MEKIKLNNGVEMPMLGIGTFLLTPDQAEESVYNALKAGYRLIDTANAYVNEKGVGRGIKKFLDKNDIKIQAWYPLGHIEYMIEKLI